MNSVVEGFFLHRAHIVLHERLDIKADHVAWMFCEQCVEIILWLRLIQNLDDIPLTGEEIQDVLAGKQIDKNKDAPVSEEKRTKASVPEL